MKIIFQTIDSGKITGIACDFAHGVNMIRVWFNHWFSTAYRLIELMKEDKDEEIYVIGSNKQVDSVIRNVCDEWYQDSFADGREYTQDCLSFCRMHKVDVFVPRRGMLDISKNIDCFKEAGVKVMVEDYEMMKLLNNKALAYDFFRDCGELHIPDYYIANNVREFKMACQKLREKYDQICVKFVRDEGALSYRKIIENADRFGRLRTYPGAEVTFDAYTEALAEEEIFDDLMIMPYLPGNEISVDCLNTNRGLIAIPRIKGAARHETVRYDDDILKMTQAIMKKTNLKYPCNIQFKMKEQIPYLLEVNTRMSGGLQMSCLAGGVNIPNIALNRLLGKEVEWELCKDGGTVSYIEIPQMIS